MTVEAKQGSLQIGGVDLSGAAAVRTLGAVTAVAPGRGLVSGRATRSAVAPVLPERSALLGFLPMDRVPWARLGGRRASPPSRAAGTTPDMKTQTSR